MIPSSIETFADRFAEIVLATQLPVTPSNPDHPWFICHHTGRAQQRLDELYDIITHMGMGMRKACWRYIYIGMAWHGQKIFDELLGCIDSSNTECQTAVILSEKPIYSIALALTLFGHRQRDPNRVRETINQILEVLPTPRQQIWVKTGQTLELRLNN